MELRKEMYQLGTEWIIEPNTLNPSEDSEFEHSAADEIDGAWSII